MNLLGKWAGWGTACGLFVLSCASSPPPVPVSTSDRTGDAPPEEVSVPPIPPGAQGPCSSDEQCAMVAEGSCGPCGSPCELRAVTREVADAFNRAVAGRRCESSPDVECEACPELVARCEQGECVARGTGR